MSPSLRLLLLVAFQRDGVSASDSMPLSLRAKGGVFGLKWFVILALMIARAVSLLG